MNFSPADLTVVIPTRDRWPIVQRTLTALRAQSAQGFRVLVVVDGEDQDPPHLGDGVRVVQRPRAGPAAARNAAVRETATPLVLFLGDDMIPVPQLVAVHLAGHNEDTAPEAGVLGHVEWHPEVAQNRLLRWMDWSGTQFNYVGLASGADAHWTRFYSCNVSLKREFLVDVGGFDEDFVFYYEDLDCGWRLGEKGFRLRYRPAATTQHLHSYDWDRLIRRFDGIALGERLMADKHPDFSPFYKARCEQALAARHVSPLWPLVVDAVPARLAAMRRMAEERANRYWYRHLAPRYLSGYRGAAELEELKECLSDRFDLETLRNHEAAVEAEEAEAPSEAAFYRTSEMYLYDLTVFAMSPTKAPYFADLRRLVPPGARLLDYGCGIGSDGLRLIDVGYDVAFADFDNPSTRYLRWRLDRRGLSATIHDVDADIPDRFDAVYCFDVIEHVDDPLAFLARLEELASTVIVNLVGPTPHDTHLHKPLDIPGLLAHARRRGLIHYRRYHERVHLVAYRSDGPRPGPLRSAAHQVRGRALSDVREGLAKLPPRLARS